MHNTCYQDGDAEQYFFRNEKISPHGGMSRTRKQAELVRYTADGKVILLATGETLSTDEMATSSSMKRLAEVEVDDHEALRSVARQAAFTAMARSTPVTPASHETS